MQVRYPSGERMEEGYAGGCKSAVYRRRIVRTEVCFVILLHKWLVTQAMIEVRSAKLRKYI